MRKRSKLSASGRTIVDAVEEYLDENRQFWPMTLRGLHYALVEGPLGQAEEYRNTNEHYKMLGVILTKARLEGLIPWAAMADNHREIMESAGNTSAESFIRSEAAYFLKGYSRDLSQGQPYCHELWIEKDTLARIAHEVAADYNIPVIVARGYSSISFVNDCRNRVEERMDSNEARPTRILYFGDMDPSGWNMLPAMMTTLQGEMGLGDSVTAIRCALTPQQIKSHKLPNSPNALKDDAWQRRNDPTKQKGDPRAEAYKQKFGKLAVELDALGPRRLQALVRSSIEEHIDIDIFQEQQRQHEKDVKKIAKIRAAIEKHLPRDD